MIEGLGTLVRLVLSLATVLLLMFLLARYLRTRQIFVGPVRGAGQRRKKAPPLEVVTRQGLSRGSSVAVVRVSGQLLLLGVTDTAVSVLRELEEVEEPEPAAEPQAIAAPPQGQVRVGTTVQSVVETLRQLTVRHG